MKKTFNINIAGFPFVIDEDAYNLLNDYLKTIEHAFRHVDGAAELISDLESRIAELLLQSAEDGSAIITLADVEQIIARVGNPEEFVEDETVTIEDEEGTTQTVNIESETVTPPPYIPDPPRIVKRLYRDPQNSMIGGVCSGLAWYIGWDVTWVRLLFVVLSIISYATWPIVYLVLWIVVPEARTPLQRMQMMGEQPTMENIGKTVTDNFKEAEGIKAAPQSDTIQTHSGFINTSFNILAKCLIILGLIIGLPILIGLAVGLLGCVLFMISWGATLLFGTGMPFDDMNLMDPYMREIVFWGVLCGVGWILTIGIPLFYLIRRGLNFNPIKRNVRKLINIIWGLGFILAGVATGMVISSAYNQERYHHEKYMESRANNSEEWGKFNLEEINVENISADQIDSYLERLNNEMEKCQDKADALQSKAEKLMNRAEAMMKKARSAKKDTQTDKFNKKAAYYQKEARKNQEKAEEWQTKAENLMGKAEKLMSRTDAPVIPAQKASSDAVEANKTPVSPNDSVDSVKKNPQNI